MVRDIAVSTISTPAPKDPSDLPPGRITWIIMGTLLVFLIVLLVMYYVKNFNLFMCDLDLDCFIDYLSSCGQCLARCVSIPFHWQSGYTRRGSFHLTPAHDIDIDNDMSSGDVELSIHYSGMTIERRKSEYLMDEDDHIDVAVAAAGRPRRTSISIIRSNSFDSNSNSMEGVESKSRSNSICRINSSEDSSCGSDNSSCDQDGSPLLMPSLLSRSNTASSSSTAFSPLQQYSQSNHSCCLEAINEQSTIDDEIPSPTEGYSSSSSYSFSSTTAYNPLSVTGRSTAQKGHHSQGVWGSYDRSITSSMPFSPTIDIYTRHDKS